MLAPAYPTGTQKGVDQKGVSRQRSTPPIVKSPRRLVHRRVIGRVPAKKNTRKPGVSGTCIGYQPSPRERRATAPLTSGNLSRPMHTCFTCGNEMTEETSAKERIQRERRDINGVVLPLYVESGERDASQTGRDGEP
ncbi:unnamed protein product [Leuciscus chuanchicus]